jgi:hypothetical protein
LKIKPLSDIFKLTSKYGIYVLHVPKVQLRWKQVRILHGPATVLKESLSLKPLSNLEKAKGVMKSKSGDMHRYLSSLCR